MSDINFCNTKEQLNHLGEVVTGKTNGSPTGADIDTSTLPYTGQVRKTLPALEQEYLEAIQGAGGVPVGVWTSGVTTFNAYNEYAVYNGIPYKPRTSTSLPYVAQGSNPTVSPDDANVQPYQEITESDVVDIVENSIPELTDIVYGDVSEMTSPAMSKVKPSSIDSGDIQASVRGYNGTWVDSEKHATRTEYILTTLQRVRDSLNDQAWTPDGQRDFYLYGGTTYVAKISGSQYSLNTLGVKSGEDITVKLNAALSNHDIAVNGLEIPAGTFYLSGNINCDFSNPIIKGMGQSMTKLIFTSDAGFVFGSVTPIKSIDMSDLSIYTRAQANSGAAIYANHEIGSRPTSTFRRLFIAGVDPNDDLSSGNWFFRGIHTVNSMQPDIDNCRFIGAFATTFAEANRAEAAIKIEATDGAVIPRITNCWSLNFSKGVMIRSSSTPSIEGVYISQCDWVYVNCGVDIEFTSSPYLPPQVNISNMHTEAFYQNIKIKGAKEILINGCLLYSFNSAEPLQQIIIEDSENIRVHGNILVGRPNNTNTEGIRCTNCDIVDVYDNTISTVNTHIAATGTTKFMKERGNTFLGSGNETADITGNTTNKIGRTLSIGAGTSYSYYNSEGFLIQGGSISISLDGNGNGVVNFPRSFVSLLSVRASNGNAYASVTSPSIKDKTILSFGVNVTGQPNQQYQLDWEATGV